MLERIKRDASTVRRIRLIIVLTSRNWDNIAKAEGAGDKRESNTTGTEKIIIILCSDSTPSGPISLPVLRDLMVSSKSDLEKESRGLGGQSSSLEKVHEMTSKLA